MNIRDRQLLYISRLLAQHRMLKVHFEGASFTHDYEKRPFIVRMKKIFGRKECVGNTMRLQKKVKLVWLTEC